MAVSPSSQGTPQLSASDVDGVRTYELAGDWNLCGLQKNLKELASRLTVFAKDSTVHWDLRPIQALDHAGAMVLWRAWGRRRPANLSINPEHEPIFAELEPPSAVQAPPKRARAFLWGPMLIAHKLRALLDGLVSIVTVFGQVVLQVVWLARNPAHIPWREISSNIYRTGAQALGITALVGFLIGVVLSYLSAQQLKLFGADAFIINILGISVIRELGPVLAAILIAGRSGSAITAQLGVMRVTQELDAMVVMGIPHTLRLILPKMLALAISMPLIVFWTDAIALLGGMVSAHSELDVGYRYFLTSLPDAVPIANLWLGLGKGVVFGLLIALVACHFGLRIEPNTESLGIGTTSSVVTSITVVILIDAVFAVIFKDVGIS